MQLSGVLTSRAHPPSAASGAELRQYLCRVHNVVNRSLDKPSFNCRMIDARWGALDCAEENACSLTIARK